MAVGAGDAVMDYAMPEPDPPPLTTIAWRMGHIAIGIFGARAANHFGDGSVDYQTTDWSLTAKGGVELLDHHHDAWIDGVRALGPDGLAAAVRAGGGTVRRLPDGGAGAAHHPRGTAPRRRDRPHARPVHPHRRIPMTTPAFQICIDAADPHLLNRFWAAATGYDVEDHHDGILEIIDAGYATLDDTIEIDGRLAWKIAAACSDPAGTGPRLLFQAGAGSQDGEEPGPPRSAATARGRRPRSGGRPVDRARRQAPLGRPAGSPPVGHDGRPRRQRVLRLRETCSSGCESNPTKNSWR